MKLKLPAIVAAALLLGALAATPLSAQISTNAPQPAVVAPIQVPSPPTVQPYVPSARWSAQDVKQSLAIMIPIIAIIMGCSIPIVIVGLSLYFQHRKNVALQETVRTMVEKGVPIPPELFQKQDGKPNDFLNRPRPPRNDLRTGLILTGFGLGLIFFIGKSGCIFLFLGVAFIVIAALEKKDKQPGPPPQP
jgi:hypothetical protein